MNKSLRYTHLLLALLVSLPALSLGSAQMADAKPKQGKNGPPDWAPAWGYRCQEKDSGNRLECRRDRRVDDDDDDDDDWRHNDNRDRFQQGRLESGTIISVDARNNSNRIVLRRDERLNLTLIVDENVRDDRGRVAIPRGSLIEGELRPSNRGIRFVADELILRNGRRYDIRAESDVIYSDDRYADRRSGNNSIVTGAARVILGSILGGRLGDNIGNLGNILNDDTFRRSRDRDQLVVIYPDQDLDLRLRSDLVIR